VLADELSQSLAVASRLRHGRHFSERPSPEGEGFDGRLIYYFRESSRSAQKACRGGAEPALSERSESNGSPPGAGGDRRSTGGGKLRPFHPSVAGGSPR
jgi:hypothetical protein